MIQPPIKAMIGFLGAFLVLLTLGSLGLSAYREWGARTIQPIAFNHNLHANDASIECAECHSYYLQGPRSGLPDAETCNACHSEAITESPEEAKLISLYQNKQPIVFHKLFHLPKHVYYSHRRHVVAGKIECVRCHGEIANTETPPEGPLVKVSMKFCVKCHEQEEINTDCKSCHR